jgi:hypothetical protein
MMVAASNANKLPTAALENRNDLADFHGARVAFG